MKLIKIDKTTGGISCPAIELTENIAQAIHEDAAADLRAALRVLAEESDAATVGPIGDVNYLKVINAAKAASDAASVLKNVGNA